MADGGSSYKAICMQNCTQTDRVGQGFWLHLRASGDGLEIAEYDLPTPNYYDRKEGSETYKVAWLLDGYFGTSKGKAYLNDVIARLSMGMQIANRLDFAPKTDTLNRYELRQFQNLPSLPRNWGKQNLDIHPHHKKDAIFWAIKLQAIQRIRCTGFLDYDALKDWAFDLFITKAKDRSTLRAKVRNVWEWYRDRDWKLDGRVHTMSRAEAGRTTAEKNAKATEAKVRGAVTALQFLQEKITVTSVAKQGVVSRDTARKYLKEMGLI